MNIYSKKHTYCLNCGKTGHEQKICSEPVTSWGIILVKTMMDNKESIHYNTNLKQYENMIGLPSRSIKSLEISSDCMNKIKFLLVRRKHSLGFGEFISGKYGIENINGICGLFNQMIQEEIEMIKRSTFDELWEYYWGKQNICEISVKKYQESKEKFMTLKSKASIDRDIDFYIGAASPQYDSPEWGFPKGRKKKGEGDLECAIREFCEETGLTSSDINILNQIKPLKEDFIGTNGIKYRHIYFLAEAKTDLVPTISNNIYEHSEIGDIGFFTFSDSLDLFRNYHIRRREILTSIMNHYIDLARIGRECVARECAAHSDCVT
jgi:8-oxo-dGTP pyrophosphatase MutT (NUDIX family)